MSNLREKNQKIATVAVLAALSVVFERLLAFPPASQESIVRISFGNVPIILSGIMISPLCGGACGLISDIIGCFVSGYAPYPWLMPAPFIMGFLPGFLFKITGEGIVEDKKHGMKTGLLIFVYVTVTHILSSVLITTYGLGVMRGLEFVPLLLTRIPTMITGLLIDVILVCVLYLPLKNAIKVNFRKGEDKETDKKDNERDKK